MKINHSLRLTTNNPDNHSTPIIYDNRPISLYNDQVSREAIQLARARTAKCLISKDSDIVQIARQKQTKQLYTSANSLNNTVRAVSHSGSLANGLNA